ncbi:MAG: MFS transporter [Gammaproteobacteria bacterium]|nr:MFS transporter [Gammaproteobacteria bacterium]
MSQFKIAFEIIGVLFLYNMGHHALPAVWTFWGIEKFDWTPREIGYSLGFIGILMVFSQGYLIRIVIPALGMRWAGLVGLSFTITAFLGYALSQTPTMAYMFMIAGALGGLAGPAMSGIASSQVGPAQQGELQGAIGSVGSLTNIISPLMMTIVFGIYTAPDATFYFPGAPFILAAILTMMSLSLFFWITIGFAQKATEDPS